MRRAHVEKADLGPTSAPEATCLDVRAKEPGGPASSDTFWVVLTYPEESTLLRIQVPAGTCKRIVIESCAQNLAPTALASPSRTA